MIVRVSAETGRSVADVADDSFALTLWTHLHLTERERTNGHLRTLERLDAAQLGAVAFHEPQQLRTIRDGILRDIQGVDEQAEVEAARARARDLIREVAQLDAAGWTEVQPPGTASKPAIT